MDIISVGNANIDLFVQSNKLIDAEPKLFPGGSACNFAVNCSYLGLSTGFYGYVGKDEFGQIILSNLKKKNVKFLGKRVNKQTGFVVVFSKSNFKKFIKYKGANVLLNAVPRKYKNIHLATPNIELLKNVSNVISLDPGSELSKHSLNELLPHFSKVKVFLPNKEEIESITLMNYKKAAKHLSNYIDIVVVKLGPYGCYCVSKNKEIKLPAVKTNVVDTTGAGDAFDSGFMYEYLKGSSLEKCCKKGLLLASKVISKLGAQL